MCLGIAPPPPYLHPLTSQVLHSSASPSCGWRGARRRAELEHSTLILSAEPLEQQQVDGRARPLVPELCGSHTRIVLTDSLFPDLTGSPDHRITGFVFFFWHVFFFYFFFTNETENTFLFLLSPAARVNKKKNGKVSGTSGATDA